uniref:Beta-lactamase domain-containing protein n=1 Tax=Macrostomum lignano TaxID=282301 RepID=A0A1I8GUC9_9PLAT
MRCQGIRQLHAAAVHAGRPVFDFRLEATTAQGGVEVRDLNRQMLLSLASVSKGMLGTALPRIQNALLGQNLSRDTPGVVSLLKLPLKSVFGDEFWFIDQTRTDLVTLEDLMSHSTGVARHDSLWYLRHFSSKEELVNATGRLQAIRGFRASFRYNNLAWTVADLALQRLTGQTYAQYMREHLWTPLNMMDTFSSSEMNTSLWSRVYQNSRSIIDGIPYDSSDLRNSTMLVEAAGGVHISLDDMLKYMQLHTLSNYSSVRPLPSQFGPVNAFVAENGFNKYFDRDFYTAPDTDFPDLEIESYSKGWFRTWYRNNLAYSHGGSLFDVRCQLDVFVKRQLAVFTHTNLADGEQSMLQPLYAAILNKYLADMLLMNSSFVTESNVCSLLHRVNTEVVAVPKLNLTKEDVEFCSGRWVR